MADLQLSDPEVADYENSSFDRENNVTPGMFDGPPPDGGDGGNGQIPDSIKLALDNPESMNLASGDERAATRPGANITDDPEYKRLTAEGERLQGEKHKLTDKMLEQMEADRREMRTFQPPQLQESPKAPPAQRMAQGAMEWMQIATLLGALAGGLGRRNSTAALNAFGSAIKGFMTGNQQAYQAGVDEWKENSQKVIQDNQAKLDQYNLILKNKKMDMDQKMSMLKIAAAQYDDEITYNLAERKDYTNFSLANAKENQLMQYYADRHEKMMADTAKVQAQLRLGGMGIRASGPAGIALMRYMQEHPEATDQDIRNYANETIRQQAASRNLGAYGARVSVYANDFAKFSPIAEKAIDNFPQGKFVPWNKLQQLIKQGTSDTNLAQLHAAIFALKRSYIATLNPTGQSRVADRAAIEADHLLDIAQSPQALKAQIAVMRQEISATEGAIKAAVDQIGNQNPIDPLKQQEIIDNAYLGVVGGARGQNGTQPGQTTIRFDKNGNIIQ